MKGREMDWESMGNEQNMKKEKERGCLSGGTFVPLKYYKQIWSLIVYLFHNM